MSNGVFENERQHPVHSVAEHEILLSFRNDDDAYRFQTWMMLTGEELFLAYLNDKEDDDE